MRKAFSVFLWTLLIIVTLSTGASAQCLKVTDHSSAGQYQTDLSIAASSVPAKTKITRVYNAAAGIKLTWNRSDRSSGYYIYRSKDGEKFSLIRTLKSGDTVKATDKTAVSGRKYYYKVVPYNKSGKGAESGIKSLYRMDQPVMTAIRNPASGTVEFEWNSVDGASGYRVTYINAGVERSFLIKGGSKTSGKITGLANGKTCRVYIMAYKTDGENNVYSVKSGYKRIAVRENILVITGSGSTRTFTLKNPAPSVSSLKAAVWSSENGQDDLVWYTFKKNSEGKWKAKASASVIRHSGTILVHCYDGDKFIKDGSFRLTAEEQASAVNPRIHTYAKDLLAKTGNNLRGAYDWACRLKYQSMVVPLTVPVSGDYAGFNRQELYFVYAYENLKGNCFCFAASFYWMARELGYEARLIEGKCMARSGIYGAHSWVEVDMEGTTYIFDPETEYELGFDGYMRTYENFTDMHYSMEPAY